MKSISLMDGAFYGGTLYSVNILNGRLDTSDVKVNEVTEPEAQVMSHGVKGVMTPCFAHLHALIVFCRRNKIKCCLFPVYVDTAPDEEFDFDSFTPEKAKEVYEGSLVTKIERSEHLATTKEVLKKLFENLKSGKLSLIVKYTLHSNVIKMIEEKGFKVRILPLSNGFTVSDGFEISYK